ncbi:MAG: hypothetical protein SVV03_02650 [Candidatus Nanohaloarchaea archaeon]|nr:hypothetical protein [Candidatus Nanohaloarchaea archaeon]
MNEDIPYFTENEIKVLLAVGRENQPRLDDDEMELLNQRQLTEETEFVNKKAFQRAKSTLRELELIDTERGGNGGMVKLSLTERGVKVYELYEEMIDVIYGE